MSLEIDHPDAKSGKSEALATSGMCKAIYDEIDKQLRGQISTADLENIRPNWKKLAFAIASGVINHITANMIIVDLQTVSEVTVDVKDTTGTNTIGTATATVTTKIEPATGHVL